MIRVILWDMVGLGVILKHPSGVVFSNQAGGTGCLHPEVEGVFVPINSQHEIEDPDSPVSLLTALFARVGPVTAAVADEIDSIFSRLPAIAGVQVDRGRLADCREAWVHVVLNMTAFDVVTSEADSMTGIVTWPNSD